MVADPMRGPSRRAGVPGVRMRGACALYLRINFLWSHGAGSRKAGIVAGVMVAPRPRRVRGRYAIWPRGSRYSPRRGAAANKEKAAQARQGKGRGKALQKPSPNPLPKKILYKIPFVRLLAGCPPRRLGPGLSTCSPEKIRAALHRAPPLVPCVGSLGVWAFSLSHLPISLGV